MCNLCSRILLIAIFTSLGTTSQGATLITATNRVPNSLPQPGVTTIATSNFGSSGNPSVPPVTQYAQTFTAEVAGRLASASVAAVSLDSDPTGIDLAITALENGQPGAFLAIAPLLGLDINGHFDDIQVLNAVADFAGSNVTLAEQEQYALLFVAQRYPNYYQILGKQTVFDPQYQYPGGDILLSRNGDPFQVLPPIVDLVFEVTVETVPEPATLALVLVAGWNLHCRRRLYRVA